MKNYLLRMHIFLFFCLTSTIYPRHQRAVEEETEQEDQDTQQQEAARRAGQLLGVLTTMAVVKGVAQGHHHHKHKKLKLLQEPQVQKVLQAKPKKVTIFDMGGVLVTIHKTRIGLDKIGTLSFMRYMLTSRRSPEFIKTEVARLYNPIDPHNPSGQDKRLQKLFLPYTAAKNPDGSPFSELIALYQAGLLTSQECIAIITQRSQALFEKKQYRNENEKKIILALASTPFEPKWFAEHTSAIHEGVEALKQCARNKDMLMILSNWDKESFVFIKQRYAKDIFAYIAPENIFISGETHLLKPAPAAFEQVMQAAQCSAENKCVFFDDQEENIKGAQAVGLEAIKVQ